MRLYSTAVIFIGQLEVKQSGRIAFADAGALPSLVPAPGEGDDVFFRHWLAPATCPQPEQLREELQSHVLLRMGGCVAARPPNEAPPKAIARLPNQTK